MANQTTVKAAGVEDLIDRLKTDGVVKGKQEAEAILADAKRQSMTILDAARREADEIVTAAKGEAERICKTSTQALQLAGRDALLKLRESFQLQFENRLRKLVTAELQDPAILSKMILEVAGKSRPEGSGESVEVLLPADAAGNDPLESYVAGLTGQMLRDGVSFGVGDDVAAGVRVRLAGKDVEVDLSDESLAGFLARFLVPRFRHIMDFKS
jgi:V/A-type H+/Na+-transporting ATPase subunit E